MKRNELVIRIELTRWSRMRWAGVIGTLLAVSGGVAWAGWPNPAGRGSTASAPASSARKLNACSPTSARPLTSCDCRLAQAPICAFTEQISKTIYEAVVGHRLRVAETACVAVGAPHCIVAVYKH